MDKRTGTNRSQEEQEASASLQDASGATLSQEAGGLATGNVQGEVGGGLAVSSQPLPSSRWAESQPISSGAGGGRTPRTSAPVPAAEAHLSGRQLRKMRRAREWREKNAREQAEAAAGVMPPSMPTPGMPTIMATEEVWLDASGQPSTRPNRYQLPWYLEVVEPGQVFRPGQNASASGPAGAPVAAEPLQRPEDYPEDLLLEESVEEAAEEESLFVDREDYPEGPLPEL
ncbi:hypothetical protein GGR56DRAFT_675217 [Xylariaceae sp. FL0804]|nr:hypothetical protein GGR56DRAFT_675217 [Xylariaceae sp. FL0804]